LQSLRREYERYEMSSLETVEQYFTHVINLVNKMRVYGEEIPNSKVVEKLQRTMVEQNLFNISTLSLDDNKVLKCQLDMLIFVQVCRTIDKNL